MGVVYEAWESSMDRRVALKVLPPGIAADERALQWFVREARTAGQLSHPNVVSVYGMGLKDQTPHFAMEFVEGETLAQVLARLKGAKADEKTAFGFPRDDVAFYSTLARAFADTADGLQHAHAKKIIHRDIKPSNLILDSEGRLRILDFGPARLEGQESLTLSGDFLGTPQYMSPEQARRRHSRRTCGGSCAATRSRRGRRAHGTSWPGGSRVIAGSSWPSPCSRRCSRCARDWPGSCASRGRHRGSTWRRTTNGRSSRPR
jgi:hypothetical protein